MYWNTPPVVRRGCDPVLSSDDRPIQIAYSMSFMCSIDACFT
jgi:hypothetical protein